MAQDRIMELQQQLENLTADNAYLNSMLDLRDQTIARQADQNRRLQRQCDTLEPKVTKQEVTIRLKGKAITKLKKRVDSMMDADQLLANLQQQQRQLTESTVALLNRDKKTKLVTPSQVRYVTTETRQEVRDEVALARQRLRGQEESANISRLAEIVDQLGAKYSPEMARYVSPHQTNTMVQQATDFQLSEVIPREFLGLWTYIEEPTAEEEEMYEAVLLEQIQPPVIYSPRVAKPHVNWMRLNTNMYRNLPVPSPCPIHGCAEDPKLYTATKDVFARGRLVDTKPVFESAAPFGSLYGFHTSMGVVAVPDIPIHGYLCCPESGIWVISAEGG